MNYVVCYYFALLNSNSLYDKKLETEIYTVYIVYSYFNIKYGFTIKLNY